MDLKSTLVMVVVAVIAAVGAFIFVTKIHSSKGAYDITMPDGVSATEQPSGDTEGPQTDSNGSDTEKEEKSDKVKSKGKDKDKGTQKDENGDGDNGKSNSVLDKILVPMESIVVNLGKVDSKRYLRVIISLEVKDSEIEAMIKANKVVFRDKLVSYLSSRNVSEISEQTGNLGLRTKIKEILNTELLESDDAISQVYFSDFIIQ